MGSSSRFPVAAGDRLSSLPDVVIQAIMSFLPVRQAVQTCVLSRRWEDLWCSMPCLSIDQREFDNAASRVSDDLERTRESSRFEEFVNTLLMFHRAPSLDMLWFHVNENYKYEVVERWFRRGIKCCPAVVEISSSAARFYRLPHLGSSSHRLRRCLLDSPEISSCTLKNLIVRDYESYFRHVLTITAPALVSFYLVSTALEWNWYGVLVNEMPSLVKAMIPKLYVASILVSVDLYGSFLKGTHVPYLFQESSYTGMLSEQHPKFREAYSAILQEGSKKRKRMENPKRISIKCQDTLTFQCPNLKLTEIKYKEGDVHQLFGLLSGIWRNLQKTTIMLTKA
ncbi:hypothetical protein BAE44_0017996 [Dichanthelium oligosanthes]|uniref:F-box domain-containing protein n=1 Tax=Dichanthelium oligosanthes TaxID=888268 RepID=A0A1E5V742_9POAL|nr:hypothetical protein BAE44_0017996 [Dichanthelium oligosanthes]